MSKPWITSFRSLDRPRRYILKSSGLIGWRCTVPITISIASEILLNSRRVLIHVLNTVLNTVKEVAFYARQQRIPTNRDGNKACIQAFFCLVYFFMHVLNVKMWLLVCASLTNPSWWVVSGQWISRKLISIFRRLLEKNFSRFDPTAISPCNYSDYLCLLFVQWSYQRRVPGIDSLYEAVIDYF